MTLVGCSAVIAYSSNNYQDHCVLLVAMGNNPGIGASGVPEGGAGVIEFGDSVVVGSAAAPEAEGVFGMPHTRDSVALILVSVGSHIGFAPGDMELGDSAAAPVAEGVFGMPHTCDSLVLTLLSVGSHIGFASGVVTSDPVDGKRWRTWA
jgi:predicted RecA/RadA family phage recombinase